MSLQKISYYFSETSFSKNQYVYKEGNPADFVYFVKSGEFKLLKNQSNESLGYTERKIKCTSPFSTTTADVTSLKLNLMKKTHTNVELQLAIKGVNELFGYEELIDDIEHRVYSCICVGLKGSLYVIARNDFKQRLHYPET